MIDGWVISCELALRWMSLDLTDDKSTLVQVMAWCCQATSHYLSQCWPRSLSPYRVTRPQWVNTGYWNYKVHRQQKLCEQWQTWLNILHVAPRPLWFIFVVKMDIFAMIELHWKCTCMPCWKYLPFITNYSNIYEQDSIVAGDALVTIVSRPLTITIQHTSQGYPDGTKPLPEPMLTYHQ